MTAALTATASVMAKARALLAPGGIKPTNRDNAYRVRSSNGGSYLVLTEAAGNCECAAGQRGNACCHVLAARLYVSDRLREQAAKRNIVVLRGPSQAEMLGADLELDLYGDNDISEGE